jgi:hypothetical protein
MAVNRLHVWVDEEPLSADTDPILWADVTLRSDLPIPVLRSILLRLTTAAVKELEHAQKAHDERPAAGGGDHLAD